MQRTAIVTGASRGLGEVIATYLARSGYDLVVTGRRVDALEQLATRLRQHSRVLAVAGDVTDDAHLRDVVAAVTELGGLDVLVNNASELGPSPLRRLADYPLDELRRVFDVNVVSPVALVQEALPLLRERRGLIVNITSDAAVGAYEAWGGYGSSKAALELVSRTLAQELREDRISVVTVDPGDMRTEMHQAAFPGEDISDRPLPDTTLPFWAWLFATDPMRVTGQRFQAQGERWELAS